MTKQLEQAIDRVQHLPHDEQDSIASMILEELEDRADVAAYDAAKADSGDFLPLEEAVTEIERLRAEAGN